MYELIRNQRPLCLKVRPSSNLLLFQSESDSDLFVLLMLGHFTVRKCRSILLKLTPELFLSGPVVGCLSFRQAALGKPHRDRPVSSSAVVGWFLDTLSLPGP